MIEKNNLDELMKVASERGVDSGTVNNVLNNLSDGDKAKVNEVLSDKEKLGQILANKNLMALIKNLGKGK